MKEFDDKLDKELKDAELDDILGSESKEKIGRAKYIGESEIDKLDEIMHEMTAELKKIADSGESDV